MPPKEETQIERYTRQSAEQFAALGRFVQDFEYMVDCARRSSVLTIAVMANGQRNLIEVPFQHGAMTAGPLMDIYRAILITLIRDAEIAKATNLTPQEIKSLEGVLKQIHSDYADLIRTRNDLLHGTWMIGAANLDNEKQTDFSSFVLHKFKISKDGMKLASDLPKSADQLLGLATKCLMIGTWLSTLASTLLFRLDRRPTKSYVEMYPYDSKTKRWSCPAAERTAANWYSRWHRAKNVAAPQAPPWNQSE